jgi:hypothetical protein
MHQEVVVVHVKLVPFLGEFCPRLSPSLYDDDDVFYYLRSHFRIHHAQDSTALGFLASGQQLI